MTALLNALTKATVTELAVPVSRTATASTTGIDAQAFEGTGLVILTSTAGGSGATMTVTVEQSDDNTTFDATAVATFTQVGNAASLQTKYIDLNACKRYLRITATIGGTAAFVSAVELLAMKKYV